MGPSLAPLIGGLFTEYTAVRAHFNPDNNAC